MNSLPFSVNTYNPTPTSFTRRNLLLNNTTAAGSSSSSSVKAAAGAAGERKRRLITSSSTAGDDSPASRREALLGGLSVCFFGLLTPQLKALAAFEDELMSTKCEFTPAANGLAYCDLVLGTGIEAVQGQLIKTHYIGRLENGKVFDSSYDRGKPLTFRVGSGEVIKGWDLGILGENGLIPPMLAGGKRKLKIPPELGYGARGAGCKGGSCAIPPNSVLYFDIEFIDKAV